MKKSEIILILAIVVVLVAAMYACTPEGFVIKFNSNGGSAVENIALNKGDTEFTFPTPPTKTGHEFDDWYLDAELTQKADVANVIAKFDKKVTEVTLYAKWNAIAYTISFNSDGGSAVDNVSVAYGATTFTMPAAPTKANYDFVGWYLESSLTTAATVENVLAALTSSARTITLYAKWQPSVTYNISFDTDGGGAVAQIVLPMTATTFTMPAAPTKYGFVFLGWFLENTYATAATVQNVLAELSEEDNEITIYAKWRTTNTYTVKFDNGGGSLSLPVSFFENEQFVFPTQPTKAFYLFDGWFMDDEFENAATASSIMAAFNQEVAEITIYGAWAQKYTINFYEDDLEWDKAADSIYLRHSEAFELPVFDDKNYFFDGWYYKTDVEVDVIDGTEVWVILNEENVQIDIFARLVPAWYIYFETEYGTEIPKMKIRSDEPSYQAPAAPTRPGSEFLGWVVELYDEEEGYVSVEATAENVLAAFEETDDTFKEITIYAEWEMSPEAALHQEAKDEFAAALLAAYDQVRGRELEPLTEEEDDQLNYFKNYFDDYEDWYDDEDFYNDYLELIENSEGQIEDIEMIYEYIALLRKSFEYRNYVSAKYMLEYVLEETLGRVFEDDMPAGRFEAFTHALTEYTEYKAMTRDKEEDGYYEVDPKAFLDGMLTIYEESGWGSDDLGILFHRYVYAGLTERIMYSNFAEQELREMRDSISEELIIEFTEIVVGIMQIIQEYDVFGKADGIESFAEVAIAISAIKSTLDEFIEDYADEFDDKLSTILSLLPVSEDMLPALSLIQTKLGMTKLSGLLALITEDMLSSIFMLGDKDININRELEFAELNMAIFEAKALVVLYGEDYNAAEFAANYADNDPEIFKPVVEFVFEFLFGGFQPKNKADPGFSVAKRFEMSYYLLSNMIKDGFGNKICISDERFAAIKEIANKPYDMTRVPENPNAELTPPITMEDIEQLLIIPATMKLSQIMEEVAEIMSLLYLNGEDEYSNESKVEQWTVALYLADIDIAKIQNFRAMLEKNAADEEGGVGFEYGLYDSQIAYIFYALLTAYDEDSTPFTVEEVQSWLIYASKHPIDYYLASEPFEITELLEILNENDGAYIAELSLLAAKLIEQYGIYMSAPEHYALMLEEIIAGTLTAVKAYYADNQIDLPQEAVLTAYNLLKYIIAFYGDIPYSINVQEAEIMMEFLSILELVIGNERYNSFEKVIDLILDTIGIYNEVRYVDECEEIGEYIHYLDHNLIKMIYGIFGDTPEADFAGLEEYAGDHSPNALLVAVILDNYENIKKWADMEYNYEENHAEFSEEMNAVIEAIYNNLFEIIYGSFIRIKR